MVHIAKPMQTIKEHHQDLQNTVLRIKELLVLEAKFLANGRNGFDKQRLDAHQNALEATFRRLDTLKTSDKNTVTVNLMIDVILAAKEYLHRQLNMKLHGFTASTKDAMMKQKNILKILLNNYKNPIG